MAHVVAFAGECLFADNSGLRKQFSRLHVVQDLVLDMSAVTAIDDSFIAELISLIRMRWKTRLSPVTVVFQPNSVVQGPFEATGILNVTNVVESSKESDDSAPLVIEYFGARRRLLEGWLEVIKGALASMRSIFVLGSWKTATREVGIGRSHSRG